MSQIRGGYGLIYKPYLDYETWRKTILRPDYKVCTRGSACQNQFTGQCWMRHISQWDKNRYNHTLGYAKLLDQQSDLEKKYKMNLYPQYRKDVDTTTEQYKTALERSKFITHLLADHKQQYYHKPCSEVAHSSCKKKGYYKEEQDPEYIEKTKKIKKIEKMRNQSGFMNQVLGFGKYRQKTWSYVQKFNPGYIDWLAKNLTLNNFNKEIAQVIIQKRK